MIRENDDDRSGIKKSHIHFDRKQRRNVIFFSS